jgi:hypothetical protein
VEALAVRCSGAAALDLCDVARGRLDAFWEMELAPWDTVAGALQHLAMILPQQASWEDESPFGKPAQNR